MVASDADNVIIDPKIGPIQGVQPKANAPPTSRGNIKLSLKNSYDLVDNIHFDGMYYRKDIGSDLVTK